MLQLKNLLSHPEIIEQKEGCLWKQKKVESIEFAGDETRNEF